MTNQELEMNEKRILYQKVRTEQSDKWEKFFDSGQPFTPEKRKEKKEDDELLEKLGAEATEEWFEEIGLARKQNPGDNKNGIV